MKFEKVKTLAKRNKNVRVGRNEAGEQWLGIGCASYKLEDMPELDDETVLAVLGVERTSYGKWVVSVDEGESDIYKDNISHEVEVMSEDIGMSIVYDDTVLTPVFVPDGIFWVRPEYLEPTYKKIDYRRYFVREIKGRRVLAVKDGMFLVALIGETDLIKLDDMTDKLTSIAEGARAERKRRIREEAEGGVRYEVCERCGAHLDYGEKCDCQKK